MIKRIFGRMFSLLGIMWLALAFFTPNPMLVAGVALIFLSIGVSTSYKTLHMQP